MSILTVERRSGFSGNPAVCKSPRVFAQVYVGRFLNRVSLMVAEMLLRYFCLLLSLDLGRKF
jgi:hypothetical protein